MWIVPCVIVTACTLSSEEIRARNVCLYVSVGKKITMATQSIFFSQIAFSQQSRLFIKHELMGKQGAMKSETGFT